MLGNIENHHETYNKYLINNFFFTIIYKNKRAILMYLYTYMVVGKW